MVQEAQAIESDSPQNSDASLSSQIEIPLGTSAERTGMPEGILELSHAIVAAIILKSTSFDAEREPQSRSDLLTRDIGIFLASMLKEMEKSKKAKTPAILGMIFACCHNSRLDLSELQNFNEAQIRGILSAFADHPLGKKVIDLNLSNNALLNFFTEIRRMANIQKLDLSWNRLVKVNGEIEELSQLRELDLSYNGLTSFRVTRGLSSLLHLNISGNQFVSFPVDICFFTNLRQLYCRNNCVSNIPSEMGKLIHLQELDVSYNPLVNFPMVILGLTSLNKLMIAGCALISLPDLSGLNLQECDVSRNPRLKGGTDEEYDSEQNSSTIETVAPQAESF